MRRFTLALALVGPLVPGRTFAGKCEDVLPFTQISLILPRVEQVSGPPAAVPFFPDAVLLSDWKDSTVDRLFLDSGESLWLAP